MDRVKIFDPTTEAKEQTLTFAPRPDSLRNKRLGLVENTKYNSDRLLLKIANILEEEYGVQSHTMLSKHNPGVPAHAEILNELSTRCDVVVAGIGD